MRFLDSDILIEIQRENPDSVGRFNRLPEVPLIPCFVAMELLQGAVDKQEQRKMLAFLQPIPVVWPMQAECEEAFRLFAANRLSHGLGLIDSLIAAIAISRHATLYTFNIKHFRSIPDIQLERPHVRVR